MNKLSFFLFLGSFVACNVYACASNEAVQGHVQCDKALRRRSRKLTRSSSSCSDLVSSDKPISFPLEGDKHSVDGLSSEDEACVNEECLPRVIAKIDCDESTDLGFLAGEVVREMDKEEDMNRMLYTHMGLCTCIMRHFGLMR